MAKLKLTDPFIRNHPNPEKRIEIYDKHTPGLAVRITPTGTKSFVFRYRFGEKVRRFTIGRFPKTRLAEARRKVGDLERTVSDGVDPLEAKKARKSKPKPKKFEYLANQFKTKYMPKKLKPSTRRTYTERIDGELLPAFKEMAIENITRLDIIELLEEIADRGSPYQSNRVRAVLSSVFSFGVNRGIAEFNPVKTTKPLGEESERDRFLDPDEIEELWAGFETIREPTGSLFKMLLITGQRLGETRRMKWDYIEDNIWTIPKELTKAKRTHALPLPPLALEIIDRLENASPYVFESYRRPGNPLKSVHTSFRRTAKACGIEDVRIHDLRRSAATFMAKLGTDRTVLGKVLNHKGLAGGNQTTARYDRHEYLDEKRTALNRWDHKLRQIISGTETKVHKMG